MADHHSQKVKGATMSDYTPCGGCGADDPSKRCIGCFHDFGGDSAAQSVSEATTPEVDEIMRDIPSPPKTLHIERLARRARRLERERDEAKRNLAVSRDIVRNQREFIAQLNEEAGKITIERDSLRARVAELEGALADLQNWQDEDSVTGSGDYDRGLMCGIEDRGIEDRYEAMRYGYDRALERVSERIDPVIAEALPKNKKA